ncbi:hypothetical protein M4A92_15710 [Caldibacillus thermoamylovorans]|uniref:hypothetical protein n=1 Tax=Caldibacillus thermoamylovorans TaxID=35841 RepID=UPI00203A72BE|nr:hypothetical protein [Caldibacillus thermoamylovorans]MCM3800041.1 hypothetical protein [Caldibacillus thermoamylovorans]
MSKPLDIDYQRNIITVPLITDEPRIVLISEGEARVYCLHSYGEFITKTHGGRIASIKNTECDKW